MIYVSIPISTLETTDSSILYALLSGKPNPNEECILGEDKRNRVFQSAQKGNTCFWYVFQFMHLRIGKKCCQELESTRHYHALSSEWRKGLTHHEENFPIRMKQFETEAPFLKQVGKKKAKKFLLQNENPFCIPKIFFNNYVSFGVYAKSFLEQNTHTNLYDFLYAKRLKERIKICKNFLEKTHDLKQIVSQKVWKTLSLEQKAMNLFLYTRRSMAKIYGLKVSTWKPVDGIDKLIQELKDKGPLAIYGNLGYPAYSAPPLKKSESMGNRDVFAWGKKPECFESDGMCHSVLLVGAKKVERQAFVYLIDPNDPSDPQNPSRQRILEMKFEHLTDNIIDLYNYRKQDSEVGYAYYGQWHPTRSD